MFVLAAKGAQGGGVENVSDVPDPFGDQVIYYYDARPGFTTFITLRNFTSSARSVNVLFYGPSFSTPFSQTIALNSGQLTIIDVGGLRDSGLPAQAGVAIATVVDGLGRPISTRALAGSFTVANLLTGSAFGANAAARSAKTAGGGRFAEETIIGPDNGVLAAIRPVTALLTAYYDPATLAPVSASGNQIIFINFSDTYAPAYGATSGFTTWSVFASAASGIRFPDTRFTANGVQITDLVSLLGADASGSAGGIAFLADTEDTAGLNRLVYFTESLGTFGTGYLLPPTQMRETQ